MQVGVAPNNNDLLFNSQGSSLQILNPSGRGNLASMKKQHQQLQSNNGFNMMQMAQGISVIKGMGSFGGATEADEQYNYNIPS